MAIDNLDFLNLNSLRNFPIKETCSREDTLGVITIPNDFMVDMTLAVSNDPTLKFYISKISYLVDFVTVEVSELNNGLVGVFSIDVPSHTKYRNYSLQAGSYFSGSSGVLVVNTLDSLISGPAGTFNFGYDNAALETRVVVPAVVGVSRLRFTNADGSSFALTGDVVINARTNVRFKNGPGNSVIIDVGDGLGLNTQCADTLACIKTINGIGPDSEGNFTLDFSDCAQLTPIPAGTGLILEDNCCKPCVGCSDIGELTSRLMEAESALIQLKDYYTSLNLLYEQFKTTATYTCACPPSS
jgi:hypothetical protein